MNSTDQPTVRPTSSRPQARAYLFFLHLVLVAFAALVLTVTFENRRLRSTPRAETPLLVAGDRLPPLTGRRLDGSDAWVRFEESPRETLLFVFTTHCPVCESNTDAWIELYERLQYDYEIVGIAVDDLEKTASYASRLGLPYRIVVPEDIESFPVTYRVRAVPTTIRVSPDGIVASVRTGPLTAADLVSLASARLTSDTPHPPLTQRRNR